MTTSPSSTLFDINNEGIQCLQRGSHSEAVHTFQVALMRMRDLLYGSVQPQVTKDEKDETMADDSETSSATAASASASASVNKLHHHHHPSSGSINSQYDNQFSLYDCAFPILSQDAQTEKEILLSSDIENLTSSTLLFNLGLSYHKRGLVTGRSGDLQQALSLYQKAACLAEYNDEAPEQSVLLVMAIFNNMGHIHAERFDTHEVQRCIETLEMILDSDECHQSLSAEAYDFFAWQFFVSFERAAHLAPAA